MKTAGIIVEYNPLHKGHAYHIEQTRRVTGADYVIAVMSGSFVQRGAPALLDKYTRTRMALLCGADLVLELPVLYSAGSAGDFAAGSVSDVYKRQHLRTPSYNNNLPGIFVNRLWNGGSAL